MARWKERRRKGTEENYSRNWVRNIVWRQCQVIQLLKKMLERRYYSRCVFLQELYINVEISVKYTKFTSALFSSRVSISCSASLSKLFANSSRLDMHMSPSRLSMRSGREGSKSWSSTWSTPEPCAPGPVPAVVSIPAAEGECWTLLVQPGLYSRHNGLGASVQGCKACGAAPHSQWPTVLSHVGGSDIAVAVYYSEITSYAINMIVCWYLTFFSNLGKILKREAYYKWWKGLQSGSHIVRILKNRWSEYIVYTLFIFITLKTATLEATL